jgi:predicted transcriptional regulator
VATSQLPELINIVHQAMGQLGQPGQPKEERTPAVSVRQSIRREHVVCLNCGFRGLMLRRHIRIRHGLTPDEYRQRWGLRSSHPLTAPGYTEQRSAIAKALGLGRKRAKRDTAVKSEAASAHAATSRPARKARGATTQVEAIEPAAGPGKPARTRRSRDGLTTGATNTARLNR